MKHPTEPLTLSYFFATAWAMEFSHYEELKALVRELCSLSTEERRERLRAVEAERGERLEYTYNARIRDGVAILPVTGPISPYMDFFTYYSGGTAISTLARDFSAVLADQRVNSILFEFDTPGGAVNSVSEFARTIFEARGEKPMTARVRNLCCSAGLWLAAAVGDIVVADTAQVGSLGIYCSYLDTSGFDQQKGFKEYVFRSKQSPKKNLDPATPPGAESLQRKLDALGDVFVAAVAEYRGVSAETVLAKYGQGDCLVGADAVAAGLADRVGSFEETLADLARHNGGSQPGFSGSVVKGRLVAGAPCDDDEKMDDEVDPEDDEGCPDHPDGDCPDDCPNFMPDEDASAALVLERPDQPTGASARHNPPATPATPKGAEKMADKKEERDQTTKPVASGGGGAATQPASDDTTARLEAAEREAAEAKRQAADAVAQLAAVQKDARRGRFETLSKDWAGAQATHLEMLEHFATSQEGGEDSKLFKSYVEQQTAAAEQLRSGKLFAQKGGSQEPDPGAESPQAAHAKLDARAKEIARDKGVSYAKAYTQACAENPELAKLADSNIAVAAD